MQFIGCYWFRLWLVVDIYLGVLVRHWGIRTADESLFSTAKKSNQTDFAWSKIEQLFYG